MSYKITKSDGTALVTLGDYDVDNSTPLTLVGRGVSNYGPIIAEDLLYLLENFRSPNAPENPVEGQIWFRNFDNTDPNNILTVNKLFYYYSGKWHSIGSVVEGNTPPENPEPGDMWLDSNDSNLYYWMNNEWTISSKIPVSQNPIVAPSTEPMVDGTPWLMIPEGMLWVYDSSISSPVPEFKRIGGNNSGQTLTGPWRLIGPKAPSNIGMISFYKQVPDTSGTYHNIMVNEINGVPVSIESSTAFDMDTTKSDAVQNFTSLDINANTVSNHAPIYVGITLNNSINQNQAYFGGISLAAHNLNGFDPNDVLGRGSNQTVRPTYPVADATIDLGSANYRWSTVYSNIIKATSDVQVNGLSVSTQNWTTTNFVHRVGDNNTNDYDVDWIGKNRTNQYCWMHDSTNNIYHFLPDISQVTKICLPFNGGGEVTGNVYSIGYNTQNDSGTGNTDCWGGAIGSKISGGLYINNPSIPATNNQQYIFDMWAQVNMSKLTFGVIRFWGYNGEKRWLYTENGDIQSPDGSNLMTQNTMINYLNSNNINLSGQYHFTTSGYTTIYRQGNSGSGSNNASDGIVDLYSQYNGSNNNVFRITSDGSVFIYGGGKFYGTATSAQYSDLAEYYTTKEQYEPGTLVKISEYEDYEIEACKTGDYIFGIISTDPAFIMNNGLVDKGGLPVALTGRVPTKIVGPIKKGQPISTSDIDGVGKFGKSMVIGFALETNLDDGIKIVEVAIGGRGI